MVEHTLKNHQFVWTDLPKEDGTFPELYGYKILRILGTGSFATVYLALLNNNQKVAIKSVPTDNSVKVELLKQEAKVYSRLCNSIELDSVNEESKNYNSGRDNIIKYLDFIATPTVTCLVLEYFEGQELYDVIMDQYTNGNEMMGLPEERAKIIIHEILQAVYYLHAKGIAHCDLKIENVLCKPDLSIKLIDFGLAHHLSDTNVPITKGSEPYLSPEIILQTDSNALKNDIWALGVITFAVLTSRMPFDGNHNSLREGGINIVRTRTMLRRIAGVIYQFSESEEKSISPQARDFVAMMFTRNVNQRPTAEELLKHPWFKDVETSKNLNKQKSLDWGSKTLCSIAQKIQNI